MSVNDLTNAKRLKRRRQNHIDTISEAGTFEGVLSYQYWLILVDLF